MDIMFDDQVQALSIKKICGKHDLWGLFVLAWLVPGPECAMDFTSANRIDSDSLSANQVNNGKI